MKFFLGICFALACSVYASANANPHACEVAFAELERGTNPLQLERVLKICLSDQSLTGDARAEMLDIQGSVLVRRGYLLEASVVFEQSIDLMTEPNPYTYFQLAEVYFAMKNFSQAGRTLDRAASAILKLEERRHKGLLERVEFFRNKFRVAQNFTGDGEGAKQ